MAKKTQKENISSWPEKETNLGTETPDLAAVGEPENRGGSWSRTPKNLKLLSIIVLALIVVVGIAYFSGIKLPIIGGRKRPVANQPLVTLCGGMSLSDAKISIGNASECRGAYKDTSFCDESVNPPVWRIDSSLKKEGCSDPVCVINTHTGAAEIKCTGFSLPTLTRPTGK